MLHRESFVGRKRKLLNGIVNVTIISIFTWFGVTYVTWRCHFHLWRVVNMANECGSAAFVRAILDKMRFELFPIVINQKTSWMCISCFTDLPPAYPSTLCWFIICACICFNILLCRQHEAIVCFFDTSKPNLTSTRFNDSEKFGEQLNNLFQWFLLIDFLWKWEKIENQNHQNQFSFNMNSLRVNALNSINCVA